MYTYNITELGYEILHDGKVVITQPHYPEGHPKTPIAEADREPMAQAVCDELNALVE